MKKISAAILLLLVAVVFFALGVRVAGRREAAPSGDAVRKVLYYVDPMNPALTSDKPGIAPCGMPLEPVYADDEGAPGAGAPKPGSLPPGTVRVGLEKQQLIGVRIGTVETKPLAYTLRLTGRVAPDETRIYRVTSVTEGWIRELSPATTGSFVRKDQVLGAYYSQEVQGPQQAYLYALDALDRFIASGTATPEQIALNQNNVRTNKQALRNLGMGDPQIEEIAQTRKASPNVQIRAPADGIILERNVTLGRQFDRTLDLFVIADLSRVWVLADAFEGDARYLTPGSTATVVHSVFERTFPARVSDVPPAFDAASRTLKVRLIVNNPGSVLRPDMFVDVELPVRAPDSLVVPVEAVVDSGSVKRVFVDMGGGFFEPRTVETGGRLGDQVRIVSGLMPGERIVVSGNFLIDSESRMKTAVGSMTSPRSKDPVCGMEVDETAARSEGRTTEFDGRTYFFCAPRCKESFEKDPSSFLKGQGGRAAPGESAPPAARGHADD